MEKIGIIKEIDKLGRIVIPKKLRERYFLGSCVEIVESIAKGCLSKTLNTL